MLYLGLVAGIVAGNAWAHVAGIDPFRSWAATLILVAPALVGARLLHVVENWPVYRRRRRRIWDRSDGGAAMFGGLFVAVPVSVPLLVALDVPFATFWDVTTFAILLGMIFARIGCLLNGCCAGRRSTGWWSAYLPDHLGRWDRRIPTQFLEAAWAALLLVVAAIAWPWRPFPGAWVLLVVTSYCCGRLLLESLREPESGSPFTIYHALSAAMIVVSVASLVAFWPRQGARDPRPPSG